MTLQTNLFGVGALSAFGRFLIAQKFAGAEFRKLSGNHTIGNPNPGFLYYQHIIYNLNFNIIKKIFYWIKGFYINKITLNIPFNQYTVMK